MTKQQKKAEALAKLHEAAKKHQARNAHLTYAQAYAAILKHYPKTYMLTRGSL